MHMMYDLKKKYFKDNKLLRINENTKVKDLCPFFLQLNFSFDWGKWYKQRLFPHLMLAWSENYIVLLIGFYTLPVPSNFNCIFFGRFSYQCVSWIKVAVITC